MQSPQECLQPEDQAPPSMVWLGPDPTDVKSNGQEDSKDQDHDLAEGKTSVVLRALSPTVTMEGLLEKLDELAKGKYDYVYLPYSSRQNVNISLGFINFVDHVTAKRVYRALSQDAMNMRPHASARVVCEAKVQGIAANLAYFVATAGVSEVNNPHAPRVFKNGERCDLFEAINEHVSCTHLLAAQQAASKLKQSAKVTSGSDSSYSQNSKRRSSDSSGSRYSQRSSNYSRSSASNGSSHSCSDASRRSTHSSNEGRAPRQIPRTPQRKIADSAPMRDTRSDGMLRRATGQAGYRNPHARYIENFPEDDGGHSLRL
eukprot:TRINITY_DN12743_c0_g2_i1.p1 TRINITY_DN12743_c0_g2~~TRINITY_DN12743_c0_g2_i1.p1  ORF type:complete len:316 (+),score=52.68 TRINITY_DN12743_c0_g2_i1:122-1069(+)